MIKLFVGFDEGSEGGEVAARPLRGIVGLPDMLRGVCMQVIRLSKGIPGVGLVYMEKAICDGKSRGDVIILAVKEMMMGH